jgi:hypothetical protein
VRLGFLVALLLFSAAMSPEPVWAQSGDLTVTSLSAVGSPAPISAVGSPVTWKAVATGGTAP